MDSKEPQLLYDNSGVIMPVRLPVRVPFNRPRGSRLGQMPASPDMNMWQQLEYLSATSVIRRGATCRVVSVGTTPTAIIEQSKARKGYILLNPASSFVTSISRGILTTQTAITTNGNTQSTPLGVSNYKEAHLTLNVTLAGGTAPALDVYAQMIIPSLTNSQWVDTQLIFNNANLQPLQTNVNNQVAQYYTYLGPAGLSDQLAVRWVLGGTNPQLSFSIGYVLKEALPGSDTGLSRSIYIGGNSGVTVTGGYPLLEGQSWEIYLEENASIWAVAQTTVNLNIFEMQ